MVGVQPPTFPPHHIFNSWDTYPSRGFYNPTFYKRIIGLGLNDLERLGGFYRGLAF